MKKQNIYSFLAFGLISLSLLYSNLLFGPPKNDSNEYAILDAQGKPSQDLKQLLLHQKIEHDDSLPSIVAETQKKWLGVIRPSNTERWEIDQTIKQKFEQNREVTLGLLSRLGLSNKIMPQNKYYDYTVLLGCRLVGFCKRIAYMLELYKAGIYCNSLVVLAGERPLMQEENKNAFLEMLGKIVPQKKDFQLQEFPNNEADMMQYVLDAVEMPEELRSKIIMVRSPMKTNAQGTLVRPTTGDTVAEWLKLNPKKGSVLGISDQPYCKYQHSVLKTYLPGFIIETVGDAAQKDLPIALYLDTLARILYQENIRLKAKN